MERPRYSGHFHAMVGVARTGSVEICNATFLVLLDRNPLEETSAVRGTVQVMKGEPLYRPDRLYKAVACGLLWRGWCLIR